VELESGGLAAGLRHLVTRAGQLSRTHCELAVAGPVTVANNVAATHLYRIAQEAITNALKHARATRIAVRLDGQSGRVHLSVRDDGCGIAEPTRPAAGMGLRIMAHRAAVTGGRFHIGPAPGGGTLVTCEMPNP